MTANRVTKGRQVVSAAREGPPAPEGLAEAGRALWEAVTGAWDLAPHLLTVLEGACRELDRAALAEVAAAAEPWPMDRYGGVRAHPGISVARSSRLAASRLLRVLDLELPGDRALRRPRARRCAPQTGGERRR